QNGSVSIKADNTETYGIDTTVTVNPDGVKFEKYGNGTTVINGQTIQAGGVVINGEDNGVYKGTITGLTNTTLDDETFATVGRAATEEQLKQAAAASKTTLSDGVNTTVTSNDNTPDGHVDYQVNLNDNVYLGGNNKPGSSNIELDGENGTIQVGSNIILDSKEARAVIGGVDISTTFDDIGKKSSTITGLSNTTWDTDKVVIDRAATEGQLQMVSDKVTAGWTATDDAGNKINVNPETRPTLNFASGKNITVSANEDSGEVEVSLNDNINLNDRVYINGDPEEGNNTIVDIKSGNTSKEESIFAVEDKGNGSISIGGIDITNVDGPYLAVGDGKLKFYKDGGLSTGNATGTFSVRPDGDLEISGKNSSFDVDAETGNINAENNSGSSIKMDGNGTTIAVNDGTVMGNNTTMTVNKDGVVFSAYGNGTTVINGQTISAGGVVINNNGSGTINGLTNTTWDDELAKQVANSEELQGTAATQGQLQQAVSEVATEAGKHTIVSTPKDSNLTVTNIAENGEAANYQVTLNDDITLGDKTSTSITLYTDPTSETTVVGTDGNTTNVTGYVPESYKSGTGADFVKNNGGFALFTTDTQGHGIFGVTTKGTAHGKDFVTYTKDIYGNDTRYSLNDVGDAVAQMSSYYNEENRKSYTVFSRYLNEAEKDNPFVTVDEDGNKINATRDIPLALRDDGAVLIGATIKGEDFTDNGIRINAETKTTYDKNGNEVTNNIATITGLENTEWKPKAPEQTPQAKMATFAANDETTTTTTTTSRAATEAQLDDLYNVVSVYNTFDNNGNVNYNTIKLRGDEYSYNEKNPVDSKGTSITNVAYASGTDGSEAVNVDYLNDAINNAVKDGGAISDSDRHLQEGTYHVNDQGKVELIVADEKGENRSTVTIDNIANKNDITNLDNKIDNTFNDLNDKINNIDNVETDVKGGNINEDGTISLKTENEDGTTTNVTLKGQLTDSGVVQEGTTFDKETGTLTITSQDKYSGKTSSVTVDGIASTDVVGVTTKEELADKYKAADEDGNATTEYITDSESMVEADVALDHAIQDVANTSYANDMVLSNRIDSVEKRLGNVEERIDKVGAMAAAIANLRTMGFDPEAPTEIAIGVGQYKSETGIAIGVFHYPNQDFMLSASLSSSGDELMGGIGATWKLGRKSAAERAKDEEARHLEQAEEMKKLAQQEKVKAQAQRHAKLLAERQQASQKNA
uniref:YadA-like family protein n=1 Tax=Megamonas rupellensis TaxID=491921 RepID=UPI000478439F